ncbi:endonuclease/exonuclease/phosphatase family protein [Streptomyces sp. NPDC002514]|uniref:endonuclease/exonuclease/phosphatase family protein n=1 Tax=Streptomyces sp. NPDC001270 TaxID=3364554 RepID=UPI00369FB639
MLNADTVTVAVWNIEADGGRHQENRERALDILAPYEPDIFLQQEAKHSRERGQRLKNSTARRLKLHGFLSEPNPDLDADIATAVYVRRDLFEIAEERPVRNPWYLHPCHVKVFLRGCPVPLNLVSFHLCFDDADQRLREAQWLTRLAAPGMVTIAAGDTNSYPRQSEWISLPDWPKLSDRAHMVHRTFLEYGQRHSDTRPDGTLIDAGYVDLARHAADHIPGIDAQLALAATAGHEKPEQGGPQRIDRPYGAGGIASAVKDIEVIDTTETRKVGDHSLLILRFYQERLNQVLTSESLLGTA